MIYTEPFVVTGGGPGEATSFLSIDLVKMALGQVDLGNARRHVAGLQPDHADGLLDLLHLHDPRRPEEGRRDGPARRSAARDRHGALHAVPAGADLLAHQHELQDQHRYPGGPVALAARIRPSTTTARSSSIRTGTRASSTRSPTCCINTVISVAVALPAAYAFSRYRFVGDKPLFFWLLSNLMAPPAVYAMPFFNLYSATGLFDIDLGRGAGPLPVQRAARGVDSRRASSPACRARSTRPR